MSDSHSGAARQTEFEELRSGGKTLLVPSTIVDGRRVIVRGRWPRVATVKDEEWVVDGRLDDATRFVEQLRNCGIGADLFSWSDEVGANEARGNYYCEWDNAAVIRTSDFNAWWNGLPQEARKNVRRAEKRGLSVRKVVLDDDLVRGIKRIYDETPMRQGRRFWHYGKDIEIVRAENSSYLDRSEFLGAFYGGELVGFVKWTKVGVVARIMQILALASQQDRRPMNALIAKAAEACSQSGIEYLVYSKFTCGRKGEDSVTEFKRRMGFEEVKYARYYVPLTFLGSAMLRVGAHRGLIDILPPGAIASLKRVRAQWLKRASAGERGERALPDSATSDRGDEAK